MLAAGRAVDGRARGTGTAADRRGPGGTRRSRPPTTSATAAAATHQERRPRPVTSLLAVGTVAATRDEAGERQQGDRGRPAAAATASGRSHRTPSGRSRRRRRRSARSRSQPGPGPGRPRRCRRAAEAWMPSTSVSSVACGPATSMSDSSEAVPVSVPVPVSVLGRRACRCRRRCPSLHGSTQKTLVLVSLPCERGVCDGQLHVVALLRVRLAGEGQRVGLAAVEAGVGAGAAGRVAAHEDLRGPLTGEADVAWSGACMANDDGRDDVGALVEAVPLDVEGAADVRGVVGDAVASPSGAIFTVPLLPAWVAVSPRSRFHRRCRGCPAGPLCASPGPCPGPRPCSSRPTCPSARRTPALCPLVPLSAWSPSSATAGSATVPQVVTTRAAVRARERRTFSDRDMFGFPKSSAEASSTVEKLTKRCAPPRHSC